MTASIAQRSPFFSATSHHEVVEQLGWFVFGAAGAFAVPFVFADRLDLNANLYYLLYFTAVVLFLAAYLKATHVEARAILTRRWVWSAAIGLPVAAFVVANVLREDATARPEGLAFAWALFWRGLVYGAVDALLLSGFPAVVAWSVLGRQLRGARRVTAFVVLSLVLTVGITATYHWGYGQYRDHGVGSKGIGGPEIGNTVMSLPTVATVNPLGSVIAHVAMHVGAVSHAYETDVFLPPQAAAD